MILSLPTAQIGPSCGAMLGSNRGPCLQWPNTLLVLVVPIFRLLATPQLFANNREDVIVTITRVRIPPRHLRTLTGSRHLSETRTSPCQDLRSPLHKKDVGAPDCEEVSVRGSAQSFSKVTLFTFDGKAAEEFCSEWPFFFCQAIHGLTRVSQVEINTSM